jgi:hypothetical protein
LPRDRVAARAVAGVVAACLLGVGCTGDVEPPDRSGPRPPRPTGSILVVVGEGDRLASLDPRTGRLSELPAVPGEFVGQEAVWGPNGEVYTMALDAIGPPRGVFGERDVVGQLIRLAPGGRAETLGSRLRSIVFVGVGRGRAVVSSCGRKPHVLTLDLDGPSDWRTAGAGCGQALSPDGSAVAAVDADRLGVSTIPLGPGGPTQRVELDPDAFARLGVTAPRVFEVQWGEPGLALMVGTREEAGRRWALLLALDSGERRILPLGSVDPTGMAWQASGRMLALTECVNCRTFFASVHQPFGALRVYDASTARLNQVASSLGPIATPMWSPDGSVLATQVEEENALLLVDPVTGAIARTPLDGGPLDWRA